MLEEKAKKRKDKESFIRKFFPSCKNSPGGTFRLNAIRLCNPTSKEAMGKSERNPEQLSPSKMNHFNQKQGGKLKLAGEIKKSEPVIKLFGGSPQTKMGKSSASRDDLG